jgi:hypothetical protein
LAASTEALKVNATLAPCFANSTAIPLPIPLEAPVIRAVLFYNNLKFRFDLIRSNIIICVLEKQLKKIKLHIKKIWSFKFIWHKTTALKQFLYN